jgi:catecholate siderophore receptor
MLGSFTLGLALSAPSYAEAADDQEAPAIIVTGTIDGYKTVETTTGTKTNTALIDVPQSITVVTSEQLADQQIRSMADLVRLIPGVSAGQGEGHRDQINLRGNNSTADFFVDGLRDDVQYFRPFYNIDRVEVHKGPNAMVFGRGGGGGLVNRVTKGPISGETRIGGAVSADSFGSAYGQADVNLPIGDTAGFRLNAFYERLANHRDVYDGDRYAINPVVGAELGERVKLQLGYEYVKDKRTVDRGVPADRGLTTPVIGSPAGPLRGFRDDFFGVAAINETDFEAHVLSFRSETELTDNLTLTTQSLYGDYDKSYANVFAATGVVTNAMTGARTFQTEAYIDPTTRETTISQANLVWRVSTGPFDHVLLFGTEYTRQETTNGRVNGFYNTTGALNAAARRSAAISLVRPITIPAPTFIAGPTGNDNRSFAGKLDQLSFYVQDQLSLSESFDIIAGLRYDKFDNAVTNLFSTPAPVTVRREDDLWSPRIGVVVKPTETSSVYVSYSKSFLPQTGDQFIGFALNNAALKPEKFDNYEIGAKVDLKPGLTATVAVYRLDRTNTRANGPVAGQTVLTGAQRSSGFELGLVGRITPQWQTAFGYANTKAEITETTTAAPAGRVVGQVPRHQLSLWNRYDLNDTFGLGLGLYHQSSQFATISNLTRLPGYTRIDAALFYKISDKIEAQLNVENLTDEGYFPSAHNDNNISTGAPINARVTVGFKF